MALSSTVNEISVAAGGTTVFTAATLGFEPADRQFLIQVFTCGAGDTLALQATLHSKAATPRWTEVEDITQEGWYRTGDATDIPAVQYRVVAPAGNNAAVVLQVRACRPLPGVRQ